MREVAIKRKKWRERNPDQAARFLESRKIPVVLGPNHNAYAVDRHHLLRALYDEGVREVPVSILENLTDCSQDQFWTSLEKRGWVHPFDHNGLRHPYADLPSSIMLLTDDPFRSLAGALKRSGACAKDKQPFSEFRWADFLRSRIEPTLPGRDFDRALSIAIEWATSQDARHLPGWRCANAMAAYLTGNPPHEFSPPVNRLL